MKPYLIIILFLLLSCTNRQEASHTPVSNIDSTSISQNALTEIIETFTDSLNIGDTGKNKVEIIKHRVLDNNYVIIKFYTNGPESWYVQNTYIYECNALMNLNPDIADFNNDGLKDLTFISGTAARGANEIRRLFIYSDRNKELVSIRNSENYPNMQYNKELDCIDAFLVHGGSSTIFLKIEGDSLKEFASVHNDNNRTVYEVDKNGHQRVIKKDILNKEDIFMRYENYKPLK